MAGLNLGRSSMNTAYVAPANPPSASGTSATALAFGAAQVTSAGVGRKAAVGGTAAGVASLVLLVLLWHSLPR
jgi:hypothetical protein